MTSPEFAPQTGLPQGYEAAARLGTMAVVDCTVLPWMKEPDTLSVAHVTLQGGSEFYLASAIGTDPSLVEAANELNDHQQRNVDSMLYARLPELVQRGHAPNIETLSEPVTSFPIRVMRNQGGQRLYFARTELSLTNGRQRSIVLRLGVCDKSNQMKVLGVLSALPPREQRRRQAG